MQRYKLFILLAVFCGWFFLCDYAHAQLTREWSVSPSTFGSGVYYADPVIVDDSGNVYILTCPGVASSGARITKIKSDGTVDWQTDHLEPGLKIDYFGRSPIGGLYVAGFHEIAGGYDVSVTGLKFMPDGNLAWHQTITPTAAPYFSSGHFSTVDTDGNLWISLSEWPIDSFCVDSMPWGWGGVGGSGTISHGVLYRFESQTGLPAQIDRLEGDVRQPEIFAQIVSDVEGKVDVMSSITQFCCDDLCQGCRDSCFTDHTGRPYVWRQFQYLRRYTNDGSFAGSALVSATDDEYYSTALIPNRNRELITVTHRYMSPPPYWSYLSKPGHWTVSFPGETISTFSLTTDYSGNIFTIALVDEITNTITLRSIDGANGAVRWAKNTNWGTLGVDRDGNVLLRDNAYTIHKYNSSGDELWTFNPGYVISSFVHCDTLDNLFYKDVHGVSKYSTRKVLVIRDANKDSLPNVQFDLIKVTNNPPWFDEDTLGTFTTNDKGRIELIPFAMDSFRVDLDLYADTLVVGDSLKFSKHVQSVPAVKHQNVLGTMYSAHLDNARLAADGHIYFDTLTSGDQDVVLNHTELRYNLVVSVEWEATEEYLWMLEDNFRFMSNYLYDVADGQIRLDTVYIFDNDAFSWEADILILASNMEWPRASAAGILRNGIDYLYMPRIWMGDSTFTRNHTDAVYPLNLVVPSKDYRTKAHEFGHYALNFFDEYLFWHPDSNIYSPNNRLRCLPTTVFRYGFMDYQYEGGGMSSEMSNSFRYELAACRNTNQWGVHALSCWDHLERWVEAVRQGPDNLFVPILKPDVADTLERVVSNPGVFFAGPNNDLSSPDYDVGSMIRFPNPAVSQFTGYSNKHVTVHHSTGGDNAKIQLWNNRHAGPPLERIIEQGRSSDAAGAWVLGVKDANYQILASKDNSNATVTPVPKLASTGEVRTGWLYGIAESGGSGVSKVGNYYTTSSNEDSLTIEMNEVHGYYPLICQSILTENGMVYDITAGQPFQSEPGLELLPSYGGAYSQSFIVSGDDYVATVSDSLGRSGSFTLWASDDSSKTFFVPTGYSVSNASQGQPFIWLFAPEGQSEFKLDSANVSLTKAMILSSPYPVIRTGLDVNAVQAGQAHCLSVYPDNPLTGSNQIVIRYDDADLRVGNDLIGDEASLSVYHWTDMITGWELIGGVVDTVENTIYASITQSGVYAAFTTDIISDVEDEEQGKISPYRFELSQNYPNPFNPVTTIEYNLPRKGRVTIEVFNMLGQRVRTLIDREESSGSYTITWDGTSAAGKPLATGVYLYRFQAGDYIETKKMMLLK